jgi:hypothetical protein
MVQGGNGSVRRERLMRLHRSSFPEARMRKSRNMLQISLMYVLLATRWAGNAVPPAVKQESSRIKLHIFLT